MRRLPPHPGRRGLGSRLETGAMSRPLYTYFLVFLGVVALLGALFRPAIGVASIEPGGALNAAGVLMVQPGGPLDRAGARTGDLWISAESIAAQGPAGDESRPIVWKGGIPRGGEVRLRRGTAPLVVTLQPEPPVWPLRLAWSLLGLLNAALVALAIALFWQHPRDGRAVLMGLMLLLAPVFAFPGEPRLFAAALSAHFFLVMTRPDAPGRRARFVRALLLYLPFAALGLLGSALWEGGNPESGAMLFDLTAAGYALFGLLRVGRRLRTERGDERAVMKALFFAAAAVLMAVAVGAWRPLWLLGEQPVPLNLAPALIFAAALAHLVFRLRTLEVRLAARRTLQYFLTRWTLGGLFLIPLFLLVFHLGQLSGSGRQAEGGAVLVYLFWMFVAALLLARRAAVLQGLDRRFFRDERQVRESLAGLAADLAEMTSEREILTRLEEGVRGSLQAERVEFTEPGSEPAPAPLLSLRIQRGERLIGELHLGARATGLSYSSEETSLLHAVAASAATALENARLSAELLRRQRAELESRSAGLLAGAEEERRRLAADLHDQVLPELRQILVQVERASERTNGQTPEMQRVAEDLRGAMDSVRDVMEALRPSALDMLGLSAAVESYFRRLAGRTDPALTIIVRREGDEPELDPGAALELYRICQEAINNVIRHSGASRAGFTAQYAPDRLRLDVWDDGAGMDAGGEAPAGRGVQNIRYRAQLIEARVVWSAREGGGTSVEIDCPVVGATSDRRSGRATGSGSVGRSDRR